MLQKVVTAMRPMDIEDMVVSLTEKARIGSELQSQGTPVVALGAGGGILLPHHFVSLVRTFREFRPDVVHSWMYHANVVAQLVVRCGGYRSSRPAVITSVRASLESAGSAKASLRVVRRLDSWLSRRADAVVFNSRRAAEQHEVLGYHTQRAVVVPNCFDTELYRPDSEERKRVRATLGLDGDIAIGLIARFDPDKDHRGFLRAAQLMKERHPKSRFLLVGPGCTGDNGRLMEWIRMHKLDEAVLALGERHDVAAIMTSLDIAVSSSLSESFPNAIGEAMACGIPCVVTDVGDCGFLVGDTGLTVPPRNPEALTNALAEMASLSAAARRELGVRARARIIEEFSIVPTVNRFAGLYEECVHASRHGADLALSRK